MNQPHPICDPQRIQQCLVESLSDDEQAEFEAHLEVCSACREALESGAAQADDWQQVRDFLSSDSSLPLPRGEGRGEGAAVASRDSSNSDPHSTILRVHSHGSPDDSDAVESNQRESIDGVLAVLAPTDDPHMLGRLGPYEIAGVVGRGGMGVVLKALDPALNRFVAIKVLAPQLATSGAARQRFAREARAAASVVHENVVAIHAVTEGGALPYFVMPYLRGASLQKRIDADGPLGVLEILRVAIQISAGLSAAHAQGLVHRDIKPANILLEDGVERLKITDFGLARAADDASLTRTGVIAGTPQFMSPEQARGEGVDLRSDLFSLGSLMYTMCTGFPPFRAETSYGILQRICESQPRSIREINADIPQWLSAFIGRLHEKNPDNRFQTSQEVSQLLEQCLAHVRQPEVVPLPEIVVELASQPNSADVARRAVWHSLTTLRLRRAALACFANRKRTAASAATAIALIVILGWAIYHWGASSNALIHDANVAGDAAASAKPNDQTAVSQPVNPASGTIASSADQSADPGNQSSGSKTKANHDVASDLPIDRRLGPKKGWSGPAAPLKFGNVPNADDELSIQLLELKLDIGDLESRISALENEPPVAVAHEAAADIPPKPTPANSLPPHTGD